MAKEWILNSAMNRFQLNFKRNVGAVSEAIRLCQPKNVSDWEKYYFKNIRSREHITDLGQKLYIKITEVIQSEVEEITEEDCISYMLNMIISRTYDGYTTEIKTIYGQLDKILDSKISAAPDEWDRLFNVDFYIQIKEKYLGIQIKPLQNVSQIPQIFKERSIQKNTHEKFKKKYGGSVFYIFSTKVNGKKEIANKEIIDEIRAEIERLNND